MLEVAKQESRSESAHALSSVVKDALGHVKVLEFGAYAAGPCISKYLANFGASVIHVESAERPDGFRLQYPPFKDGKMGLNRSGCFAFFNDLSLRLNKGASMKMLMRALYSSAAILVLALTTYLLRYE